MSVKERPTQFFGDKERLIFQAEWDKVCGELLERTQGHTIRIKMGIPNQEYLEELGFIAMAKEK